jgi:manganese efflux pump family protein
MSVIDLLLLALGLAMDAAAVSAARGLVVGVIRPRYLLLVAVFFGGAQALMPLLGFLLGQQLGPIIATIHHWVAFALLVFLGGRMIRESAGADDDDDTAEGDPFALPTMATLAVATSIDAFAVGVVLPALGASLFIAVVVIGIVTAALSMLGLALGARLGSRLGSRLDLIGGVVLVGLGVRFLVEGLTGG